MTIVEWWNALSLATQIFYCIAVPASLVLLIQTVLLFIGLGQDADMDDLVDLSDADADTGGVFGEDSLSALNDGAGMDWLRLFTLRGIIAFAVVFGWVGAAMSSADVPLYITIPVSVVCGFVMMVAIALLMRAVMRLRSDGNTDNRNAIGTAGKVYLTVPPARGGEGKVQLMLQGSLVERGAVTDEETPIPTGSEVIVVGVSGQTDLVVKRK